MAAAKKWAQPDSGSVAHVGARLEGSRLSRASPSPRWQAAIKDQMRYPAVAAMFKSEDFVEGPMAFAQKRAPQWKGK